MSFNMERPISFQVSTMMPLRCFNEAPELEDEFLNSSTRFLFHFELWELALIIRNCSSHSFLSVGSRY